VHASVMALSDADIPEMIGERRVYAIDHVRLTYLLKNLLPNWTHDKLCRAGAVWPAAGGHCGAGLAHARTRPAPHTGARLDHTM
jgi:hypothetical protein